MSDALDYVRNNCGVVGEEVADMVDALQSKLKLRDDYIKILNEQVEVSRQQHKAIVELHKDCARLQGQRDELLNAAQNFILHWEKSKSSWPWPAKQFDELKEVVNKVKGRS